MEKKSAGKGLLEERKKWFWISSGVLVAIALVIVMVLSLTAELNILPMIQEGRHFEAPMRKPGTFAEDFSDKASDAKLIYEPDGAVSIKYTKSNHVEHPFCAIWFPLEHIDIDFSAYDLIEIGLKTNRAKRIPFNLSVQNRLRTHQYIRTIIEVEKGKTLYSFGLRDFFTPTSWYDQNEVAQIDIPEPDLSKIEALSFESCHLLHPGIEDKYTITSLVLKRDHTLVYLIITLSVALIIVGLYLWLYGVFQKSSEVIHVPISHLEQPQRENIEDNILLFLASNYTNPNLTLSDLSHEFGKNSAEISRVIKAKTKLTFPKYLNFLRLEEAKRMLKSGEYKSISEIGYAVGFNSPSNFNRVFKSVVGVSPKVYSESN